MLRAVALVGLACLLSACGGSRAPLGAPITSNRVEQEFRSEGLPLHVVVDTRTLNERRIDELFPASPKAVGAQAAALHAARVGLERMRVERDVHPVLWLAGRGNAPIVYVYGHESDAQRSLAGARRGWRRLGTGDPLPMERLHNVFVVYIGMGPHARARLDAALERLRH